MSQQLNSPERRWDARGSLPGILPRRRQDHQRGTMFTLSPPSFEFDQLLGTLVP